LAGRDRSGAFALSGRKALATEAAGGIGNSIVRRLSSAGATVTAAARISPNETGVDRECFAADQPVGHAALQDQVEDSPEEIAVAKAACPEEPAAVRLSNDTAQTSGTPETGHLAHLPHIPESFCCRAFG